MARFEPDVVRQLLLAGRAGPRLLNENSVAIDVWSAYAKGEVRPDLLLAPYDATEASSLAAHIFKALSEREAARGSGLFPLEGAVAVRLTFDAFVQVVLPATGLDFSHAASELFDLLRTHLMTLGDLSPGQVSIGELLDFGLANAGRLSPTLRTALVVLLIQTARRPAWSELAQEDTPVDFPDPNRQQPKADPPLIWRVSLNRPVETLGVSVETIKADAAQRVFDISCRALTWAVVDSGIDGAHPAFRDHGKAGFATRIDQAFDFTRLRDLASYDALLDPAAYDAILAEVASGLQVSTSEASDWLGRLQADARRGRPYDWDALSRLLETAPDKLQSDAAGRVEGHGTHVAGVLAGDWRDGDKTIYRGVCPDLRLIDLRVLGNSVDATEFAVIAALEFVRWMNTRNRHIAIHGVNLSIGLLHDKANYACGRTPVCLACETTVASGVTVVAAAGNWGSHSFSTAAGAFEGYAAMSISDPGNAEAVITVGATHRERPHEYGVSFFSSRGPTGDGRAKPDVVAPGERIDGPLPNLGFGRLDGTSMSAPHVSGVAALLMARHPELVSDPRRVKAIIISTATDLGRERHFQGAGLVDALRALQSV